MKTKNYPHYVAPYRVQHFLDNLEPCELFSVIFIKKNGEQRKITGYLDPNKPDSRKNAPPVYTIDGLIKSFRIDRVLHIDRLKDCHGISDW